MPARDPHFVTESPETRARRLASRLDNSHGLGLQRANHYDFGARDDRSLLARDRRARPSKAFAMLEFDVRQYRHGLPVEDIRAVSAAAQPHFDDSGRAALVREVPHAGREGRLDKGRPSETDAIDDLEVHPSY